MTRTSLSLLLVSLTLACNDAGAGEDMEPPCDDRPCIYDETPLGPEDPTPWDTKVADDIAALEAPVQGTWTWGDGLDGKLAIEQAGVQLAATATFVHDPATVRHSEHVAGGCGVACWGPRVIIDGVFTVTDEQGAIIISVPVTVERGLSAGFVYAAIPVFSPAEFSSELHVLETYDLMQVGGVLIWLQDGRYDVEFTYQAQRMVSETQAIGIFTLAGEFK